MDLAAAIRDVEEADARARLLMAFNMGIRILYRSGRLLGYMPTRRVFLTSVFGELFISSHSPQVVRQLMRPEGAALWHDDRTNCPTWTDAAECKCDVEQGH